MPLNKEYKKVKLVGDCSEFTLYYTPLCEHGKPQEMRLDADTESDARFESAHILDCEEDELPETEWL